MKFFCLDNIFIKSLILFIFVLSSKCLAFENFKGEAGTGILFFSGKDRLSVFDKKKISNYDSPSNTENGIIPFVFFNLSYNYSEKSAFFTDVPLGESDPKLRAGHRFVSDNYENSLYLHTSLMNQTWKDPYDLDGREETDITERGFGFDQKFFKRFGLKYEYTSVDIEDDVIGLKFNDMQRDGEDHSLWLSHESRFLRNYVFKSSLKYSLKNRDGGCEDSREYGIGFSCVYFSEMSSLVLTVSGEKEKFEKKDVIFDGKRDFSKLNFGFIYKRNSFPFNEKMFLMSGLLYSKRYSDIDFYESEIKGVFVSAGYRFD